MWLDNRTPGTNQIERFARAHILSGHKPRGYDRRRSADSADTVDVSAALLDCSINQFQSMQEGPRIDAAVIGYRAQVNRCVAGRRLLIPHADCDMFRDLVHQFAATLIFAATQVTVAGLLNVKHTTVFALKLVVQLVSVLS